MNKLRVLRRTMIILAASMAIASFFGSRIVMAKDAAREEDFINLGLKCLTEYNNLSQVYEWEDICTKVKSQMVKELNHQAAKLEEEALEIESQGKYKMAVPKWKEAEELHGRAKRISDIPSDMIDRAQAELAQREAPIEKSALGQIALKDQNRGDTNANKIVPIVPIYRVVLNSKKKIFFPAMFKISSCCV